MIQKAKNRLQLRKSNISILEYRSEGGTRGAAGTGRVKCYLYKNVLFLTLNLSSFTSTSSSRSSRRVFLFSVGGGWKTALPGLNVTLKQNSWVCNSAKLGSKSQEKACWQLWHLKTLFYWRNDMKLPVFTPSLLVCFKFICFLNIDPLRFFWISPGLGRFVIRFSLRSHKHF